MPKSFFLPCEVVSHIMMFLPMSDRKEAALVSRLWYEASLHPLVQSQKLIVLSSCHQNWTRQKFYGANVQIGSPSDALMSLEILMKNDSEICEKLKYLSFKGSDIGEVLCTNVLKKCKNLEHLDLSCCNLVFMSGNFMANEVVRNHLKQSLAKVYDLNLSSIRYLSNVSFINVTSVCCNVTKLALASISLTFSEAPYGREYNKAKDSNLITFPCVFKYISQNAQKLTSLNFSRTGISDAALGSLSMIDGLQLREVILVQCRELTDDGIITLCKNQKDLQVLDVSMCPNIGNHAMSSIGCNLLELETLKIAMCKMVTDVGVTYLKFICTLREVTLKELYNLTSESLITALSSCSYLTQLDVSFCTMLDDRFIRHICKICHFLRHLNVSSLSLTDKSCRAITNHLKYLQILKMSRCGISDVGLVTNEPVYDCESLTVETSNLTLTSVNDMRSDCGDNNCCLLTETSTGLLNLSHLRLLDLSHCSRLSDASISNVIRFKELQTIDLTCLTKITDESLVFIAEHNPSLETVVIAKCDPVTDRGVGILCRCLKRLVSFNISMLSNVTNDSIRCIAKYCSRLRSLDVSCCEKVTLEAVEEMKCKLPWLYSVNTKYLRSAEESHSESSRGIVP